MMCIMMCRSICSKFIGLDDEERDADVADRILIRGFCCTTFHRDQMQELEEHLKKHPDKYPLKDFPSN